MDQSYSNPITKGYESSLNSTDVRNDTMRITLDTHRLFIDANNDRFEISDFVKGYLEEEIRAIIAPLPKIYYASDTHKLLNYDAENNEWVVCGERNSDTVYKATVADTATNASSAEYATKSLQDGNGNNINTTYAPINSPLFTGTPSAPTAAEGSNNNQIANTSFVSNAIANAIGGLVGFDTSVVNSLPETGENGIIYFVPNSSVDESDIFDEYIWMGSRFEKIGSTKIDLTGYYNDYEITGTGNAVTDVSVSDGKVSFNKNASFLTDHPSVTKSASTAIESPLAGETIEVIDSVEVDEFGHLTNFRTKTVTIPNSVANASTAIYAENADFAKTSLNSLYSTNAASADFATTSDSAINASTAQYALNADVANTASSAVNASTAIYANSAEYAIKDGSNQQIDSTYIKNAIVDGSAIIFTRGNGSTFKLQLNV